MNQEKKKSPEVQVCDQVEKVMNCLFMLYDLERREAERIVANMWGYYSWGDCYRDVVGRYNRVRSFYKLVSKKSPMDIKTFRECKKLKGSFQRSIKEFVDWEVDDSNFYYYILGINACDWLYIDPWSMAQKRITTNALKNQKFDKLYESIKFTVNELPEEWVIDEYTLFLLNEMRRLNHKEIFIMVKVLLDNKDIDIPKYVQKGI